MHGLDLDVGRGEGHALVGPSGSGKTTVARAVARLLQPTAGEIHIADQDITHLSGRRLRSARRAVQVVFQEPQTSLDPRWRVGRSIAEPLRGISARQAGRDRHGRVAELLDGVGLDPGAASAYPHQLSIGQQQRVAIARALAPEPELLVCDEPVAALDTSVQAQIVNLLQDLMIERGLAILLVTHDLAVAAQLCETTSVLDDGQVIETGSTRDIIDHPRHARAAALVAAARRLDPR